MKKQFLILFAFISVLALSQVPQRFNKVVVTGDITSPKFIKTGSNSDSVLLGNGSARAISTIKTDTVSLSNRINAKATGNGTANGINTGDETLTSIKTKLGAATTVSDGYLKYQDWSIFNSKEPAITKNTAFNKNFGTTTGTVLEGRTFGTAANSAVGDFQPTITGLSANYIPKWNGSSFVNSLISDDGAIATISGSGMLHLNASSVPGLRLRQNGVNRWGLFSDLDGVGTISLYSYISDGTKLKILGNGDANILSTTPSTAPTNGALVVSGGIGADHVRANNFYGNGSNLTCVQLPITLTTNGTSGAATFSGNVLNVPNYGGGATSGKYTPTLTNVINTASSSIRSSIYTHIGNVYTLAIRGEITPMASGSCTLYISIPAGASSATGAFVSSAINSTGTTMCTSWASVDGLGTTYLVLIIEAPSTGQIAFSLTGSYQHQ